jgi:hypothetical protein
MIVEIFSAGSIFTQYGYSNQILHGCQGKFVIPFCQTDSRFVNFADQPDILSKRGRVIG